MDQIKLWDEAIYNEYPRHVAKRKALLSIRNARTRLHDGEVKGLGEWGECQKFLFEKTRQFAKSPAGNRETLTPHPTTFFNQARYLDEEVEWYRMTPDEMKQNARRSEANIGVWTPE